MDNNEYIAHHIKDSSINIYDVYILELIIKSFYNESELLHNFFSWLKGSKSITIVILLADNAFEYQIT